MNNVYDAARHYIAEQLNFTHNDTHVEHMPAVWSIVSSAHHAGQVVIRECSNHALRVDYWHNTQWLAGGSLRSQMVDDRRMLDHFDRRHYQRLYECSNALKTLHCNSCVTVRMAPNTHCLIWPSHWRCGRWCDDDCVDVACVRGSAYTVPWTSALTVAGRRSF